MQEEQLVRAMPRRPLYGLNGFIAKIDLAVLNAVDDEGWYATRTAIAEDVDCKEVRIATLTVRRPPGGVEVLLSSDGRMVTVVEIGADVSGLGGLKALAKRSAIAASQGAAQGIELAGYLNDDHDAELRRIFHLVYRATARPDAVAPEGMAWVKRSAVDQSTLDALSVRVIDAVV